VIFGYLFVAYLIFITMRGELRTYAGFLLSDVSVATPQASAGPVGGATQAASGSKEVTVGNILTKALPLLGVL